MLPAINLCDFAIDLAFPIIQHLDAQDHLELTIMRGKSQSAIELIAEIQSSRQFWYAGWIAFALRQSGLSVPFAMMSLAQTGLPGVAQGALLSRDNQTFRIELAQLARRIAEGLPAEMARLGLHRIQVLCWQHHQRAAKLLKAVGFSHECDQRGHGVGGCEIFSQYALTLPPSN